jgi:hypothetical protein
VGDRVTLERRAAGTWRRVATLQASRGMVNVLVKLRGHAALRLRAARQVSARAVVGARRAGL